MKYRPRLIHLVPIVAALALLGLCISRQIEDPVRRFPVQVQKVDLRWDGETIEVRKADGTISTRTGKTRPLPSVPAASGRRT